MLADEISEEDAAKWSEARRRTYDYGRLSCSRGENYVVLGIIMSSNRNLYIVYNPASSPRAEIYDECMFSIVDCRLGADWLYFPQVMSANIAHDDFVFTKFRYIGIDRIVTEENFYEKYFDGLQDEIKFVDDAAYRHRKNLSIKD